MVMIEMFPMLPRFILVNESGKKIPGDKFQLFYCDPSHDATSFPSNICFKCDARFSFRKISTIQMWFHNIIDSFVTSLT